MLNKHCSQHRGKSYQKVSHEKLNLNHRVMLAFHLVPGFGILIDPILAAFQFLTTGNGHHVNKLDFRDSHNNYYLFATPLPIHICKLLTAAQQCPSSVIHS